MLTETVQEFNSQLEKSKPLICFDYGSKKIGVAMSTPNLSMALPLVIIAQKNPNQHLKKCLEILKEKSPAGIVIGLPVNMDGSETNQTVEVRKFADLISGKTDLPIFLQDERMTSRAADNLLKSMGLNRQKRNESDDLAAASMILETTLNLLKGV